MSHSTVNTPNINAPSFVFLFTQAPYNPLTKKGLDAVLACSAFGMNMHVVFMHDSVLSLLASQDGHAIGHKSMQKIINVLGVYDIENIYACNESLQRYHLSKEDIVSDITPVDITTLNTIIANSHQVLTF